MLEVLTKNFPSPNVDIKEVLRYAGIINAKQQPNAELQNLINDAISECLPKLKYSVCYTETPIGIIDDTVDFGFSSIKSKSLASHLKDCKSAVIFASTIGLEIDRLIYKYGKLSPAKSLILQALGAERAESLCNEFCKFISNEKEKQNLKTKSRFSAGYGDFPLSFQKDIFAVLKPENKIMLTLNQSLIMTPSKSVTAVIGVGKCVNYQEKTCKSCQKTDCFFRSE